MFGKYDRLLRRFEREKRKADRHLRLAEKHNSAAKIPITAMKDCLKKIEQLKKEGGG